MRASSNQGFNDTLNELNIEEINFRTCDSQCEFMHFVYLMYARVAAAPRSLTWFGKEWSSNAIMPTSIASGNKAVRANSFNWFPRAVKQLHSDSCYRTYAKS